MPDSRWKALERAIAKKFGGTRTHQGEAGPDCQGTHPWAIQVKHGKTYKPPKILIDAMAQAVADSKPGELPTLVVHPFGWTIGDSWVIHRLKDYEEFFL